MNLFQSAPNMCDFKCYNLTLNDDNKICHSSNNGHKSEKNMSNGCITTVSSSTDSIKIASTMADTGIPGQSLSDLWESASNISENDDSRMSSLNKPSRRAWNFVDVTDLQNLFSILVAIKFRNGNLKQLEFAGLTDKGLKTTFVIQQLPTIFPSLCYIHLSCNSSYFERNRNANASVQSAQGIIDLIQMEFEGICFAPTIQGISKCFIDFSQVSLSPEFTVFSLHKYVDNDLCAHEPFHDPR